MKYITLDIPKLQIVRNHWISCAQMTASFSEEILELKEQFFDFIEQNQLYGDFYERSNTSTYIGIDLDEDSKIDVLVEVIYYRRGRIKTFKIMDIFYSPAIEALEQTEYDKKCITTLVYIVNEFINKSSDAIGGATKIYASTNTSLKYLNQLHQATQDADIKKQFDDAGLEVNLEGQRWLAFRVKK